MTVAREVTTQALPVERQRAPSPLQFRIPQTLLVRIGLIIASAMFVLPFYWMANSAIKDIHELSSIPPTLYPHFPACDNF